MSGLHENLPFARGSTYGAADNTLGVQWDGREFIIEDDSFGTGMFVKLRVCRNNSGAALLPKTAIKFNLTAGKGFYDVAGMCTVTAERTAIVDHKLPAGGVPNGDLFYAIIAGPALARTSLAGDATNLIVVGDALHAQTAVTTGATTAGRVGEALFTGATTVLAGQVINVVGYAMSAKTTGNTNADILVNVGTGRF